MSTSTSFILLEKDAPADPLILFTQWYREAEAAKEPEPSAMVLATSDPDGFPNARMVLLRGFDERGFVFFTNYHSDKARELEKNARAALVFYWDSHLRQVRVRGAVQKVSQEESHAYFRSRPFGHQLGAWSSPQSQVIPNRQILEDRMQTLLQQYQPEDQVPCPEYWGGYRVIPNRMEFWQGRDNRLHDRLQYRREHDRWIVERLAP